MRITNRTCQLLTTITLALFFGGASATDDERPNIVVILADDVGFSDIGAFGSEIATPTLDALANEGIQLTAFHAAPTCGPSRTMLFTGVDHHLAGAGINAAGLARLPLLQGRPGYEGYLNDDVVTFVSLLKDAGYHTYMTGKWDPGSQPGRLPIDHGFEKSFVLASGGASHFGDGTGAAALGAKAPYYEDDTPVEALPDDFFSSEFYTDQLIDYIGRNGDDRPYMAMLSYTAAHWPLQVPDDWLDRYAGAYDDGWHAIREARFERMRALDLLPETAELPPTNRAVDAWDSLRPNRRAVELRRMELFAAMIENMDFHIGRLVEALRNRTTDRDTIIVFLSDNGSEGNSIDQLPDNEFWIPATFDNRLDNLGRQGSFVWLGVGWAHASASPFRLYKSYTTAGALRTPAIVHSIKGQLDSGRKDEIVTMRDIAPTLLDLANVTHPGDSYNGRTVHPMSGKSALPYLEGRTDGVHGDAPLGWEVYGSRALIKGRWKAVLTYPPEGSGKWELFDRIADPTESRDLAAEHPELVQELDADWHGYAAANGVYVLDRDMGYGRYYDIARP